MKDRQRNRRPPFIRLVLQHPPFIGLVLQRQIAEAASPTSGDTARHVSIGAALEPAADRFASDLSDLSLQC